MSGRRRVVGIATARARGCGRLLVVHHFGNQVGLGRGFLHGRSAMIAGPTNGMRNDSLKKTKEDQNILRTKKSTGNTTDPRFFRWIKS